MKRHHRRTTHNVVTTNQVLMALQTRAVERCGPLGHTLGPWNPAKKKHGVHAMKAVCLQCGEPAFIMPYHCHSAPHPQVPAIKGDILFHLCYLEGSIAQ